MFGGETSGVGRKVWPCPWAAGLLARARGWLLAPGREGGRGLWRRHLRILALACTVCGLLFLLPCFQQVLKWDHHLSPATRSCSCSFCPSVTTFAIPELHRPSSPGSEIWKSRERALRSNRMVQHSHCSRVRSPTLLGSIYQRGWVCPKRTGQSWVQIPAPPLASCDVRQIA